MLCTGGRVLVLGHWQRRYGQRYGTSGACTYAPPLVFVGLWSVHGGTARPVMACLVLFAGVRWACGLPLAPPPPPPGAPNSDLLGFRPTATYADPHKGYLLVYHVGGPSGHHGAAGSRAHALKAAGGFGKGGCLPAQVGCPAGLGFQPLALACLGPLAIAVV